MNKRYVFIAFLTFVINAQAARAAYRFLPTHRAKFRADSDTTLRYPLKDQRDILHPFHNAIDLADPSNVVRKVTYDPANQMYIVTEMIGDKPYRMPQYMTFEAYSKYVLAQSKRDYWLQKTGGSDIVKRRGIIPSLTINSKVFDKLFGGNTIDIKPQGEADVTFGYRINTNNNPLFSINQRSQGSFDFTERIQMNVTGQIGDKLKILTNYNTESQFDFENQIKFEYTGKPDEIIRKIELGNVSMPLPTTLITGIQNLFGIKTQLQFGRLGITSIFSQQRSQKKQININNGTEQNTFKFSADSYDANRNFFLAQYFRDHYNQALKGIPVVNSPIIVTRIEVWVTNRTTGINSNARDVVGFIDLGENNSGLIYNKSLRAGAGFSPLPSSQRNFTYNTLPSNNLLQVIPANARYTNSTTLSSYFQAYGGYDNYAKLTYARRLDPTEYTLNGVLGYISLNQPLNSDDILTVAYQYTYNGVVYQVGELSTDLPVSTTAPQVLYTKLLKNAITKVTLPTWRLMMKNIYSLGAFQINPANFNLVVSRLDEKTGAEQQVITGDGPAKGKLWLQATGLDQINSQQDRVPDGRFDFIQGVTIDAANGRIIFPVVEPFGSDLAQQFQDAVQQQKYVYQPLYDSTQFRAKQFPQLDRYYIKGTYESTSTNEFNLNAFNIPQGSVQVLAGSIPLVEGQDYTVDYNLGRVTVINQSILNSGIPITINLEDNSLYGIQQKSLFGTRFDYTVNKDFLLGATYMNLSEKPLTQKVNVGDESINNTQIGIDGSYRGVSNWLTKMVNNIPFIQKSRTASSFNFNGEAAEMIPGHNKALNFAGDDGVSYIDDFENTRSVIDLRSAVGWYISGTPQLFPENQLNNNLQYGFNRALMAFYNVDPIFYSTSGSPVSITELSKPRVRQVNEPEIFPNAPIANGQTLLTNPLDVAFYPMAKGPYNYTTQVNADGTLPNPASRWGGIIKGLQTTDFESLNVQYIELWVMDPLGPNGTNPGSKGGNLYFDLGTISEDILKDGRRSLENALPINGLGIPGINASASMVSDTAGVDTTAWGAVSRNQAVTQSFDNDPASRPNQDVGLDGLADANEQKKFSPYLSSIQPKLTGTAYTDVLNDPSGDDYHYFLGPDLDQSGAGILKRYQKFDGMEGNSPVTTTATSTAATSLPDQEDVNRDNYQNTTESYYEYKIPIVPDSMVVGKNNIVAEQTSNVQLPNGTTASVNWYQMKIPILRPTSSVGGISDFKSIQFMRMFMTGFTDTTVLRFGRLQLLRGEWIKYNQQGMQSMVIQDPGLPTNAPDNSDINVSAVSYQENGTNRPNHIEYNFPPGIAPQQNINSFQQNLQLNEQSLDVQFTNLSKGYTRLAYKNVGGIDSRKYKRIKMFIHLEALNGATGSLHDGDVTAVVRIGSDYQENFYEYQIPLQVTLNGAGSDPNLLWPQSNNFDVALQTLKDAKLARNRAMFNGAPWPVNRVFTYTDPTNPKNIVKVLGSPDLSNIRVVMLGVHNPLHPLNQGGDGLAKNGELWFDELRFVDFDESGGWAATGRMNAKLADFANVTVTGFHSTPGWGSLEARLNDLNKFTETSYDIASNVDLSKLLPKKAGINLPLFVYYSHQKITPEYDPNNPDTKLSDVISSYTTQRQRDSVTNSAIEVDTKSSINLSNVRKLRTNPLAKPRFWDIENFSFTYASSKTTQRNYTIERYISRTFKGIIDYAYQYTPKNYHLFTKIGKSRWLRFLKDFNITPLPSTFNFSTVVDRFYSENTLRASVDNNFYQAPAAYTRNFYITRNFGVHWDLTKSFHIDYAATNYSSVDEPDGPATKRTRDSTLHNLLKGGRNTQYVQTVTLSYNVPINKIPYLDWINLTAKYAAFYQWQSASLAVLKSDTAQLGNAIQNQRTFGLDPMLDLTVLYKKIKFLDRITAITSPPKTKKDSLKAHEVSKALRITGQLLTSLKSIQGSYARSEGIFIPGFLPKPSWLGEDVARGAPGFAFILGSQADLRPEAAAKGWITQYKYLQAQYVKTYREDVNVQVSLEPLRDLRITLTGIKNYFYSNQANFKFDSASRYFINQDPVTSGTFSISTLTLKSAFEHQIGGPSGLTSTFQQLEANRLIISKRLGAINPLSKGDSAGYANGYSPQSQDVLLNSFLAAYTGTDASKIKFNLFKSVPLPEWHITYSGLSKIPFVQRFIASVTLTHGYRSIYSINSFNTNLAYVLDPKARDQNGDFYSRYQVSYLNVAESFEPLLGIDMRLKNNVTTNFRYSSSRTLSFSISNSQLAQVNNKEIVFGIGYHTLNFRLPFKVNGSTVVLKNDLNMKFDLAVTDSRSVIYQLDLPTGTVAGGLRNISIRPEIDYNLSQQFNFRVYYDGNSSKPYTSNSYNSSFSTFGISLRFIIGT